MICLSIAFPPILGSLFTFLLHPSPPVSSITFRTLFLFLSLHILSPLYLYLWILLPGLRHPSASSLTPAILCPPPQMYRLTLRTSKEPVSRHLCELLAQQF